MDLKSWFVDAGLASRADQLASLARPCVRVHGSVSEDLLLAVGASKIGGDPDVPAIFEWPAWKGAPLAFLAQINLTDLADSAPATVLPGSGLLSFFYDSEQQTWGFDPEDRGSWRVFYFSPESALARRTSPEALPDHARYLACGLGFHDALSIPPYESADIEQLELSEDEADAYFAALDRFAGDREGQPHHQLLGHPDPVQGDMQLECQLASNGVYCDPEGYQDPRRAVLEPGAAQWQLLIQLDSDWDADMMWGDGGRLFFWIRQEDLQRQRFDDVWMILQTS